MTSSLHATAEPPPPLPQHVAIVMDGNGRWAQGQGRERSDGHHSGLNPVRAVIEECARRGIGALTLFAFSSENWLRPASEVANLMSLFCDALDRELPMLHENGVRLRFVGELWRWRARLRERTPRPRRQRLPTPGCVCRSPSVTGSPDILAAARIAAARTR